MGERPVKAFAAAAGHEWVWSRPRVFRRRWVLRAGEEPIAELESRPAWGFTMTGEADGRRWRLRHRGFLRGLVEVEREVADGEWSPVARFEPGWFGAGRLPRTSGDLAWRRADFMGRRWEFRDATGRALVAFVRLPGLFRAGCRVQIADEARTRDDLPELVMLGWFLVVLMARQAHAAA